jgi:hypothetical protein
LALKPCAYRGPRGEKPTRVRGARKRSKVMLCYGIVKNVHGKINAVENKRWNSEKRRERQKKSTTMCEREWKRKKQLEVKEIV